MKNIFLFIFLLPITSLGQAIPQVSAGFNFSNPPIQANAEVAKRIGGHGYLAGSFNINGNGYPYVSVGPIVGVCGSWHSRNMVEVTDLLYLRYEAPIWANNGFKSDPPLPLYIGVRHYQYNVYFGFEANAGAIKDFNAYGYSISFNIGYAFGEIFK